MKVWKLVSGILSIILFVFVSFQSCAAGVSNALEANGEASGSAGTVSYTHLDVYKRQDNYEARANLMWAGTHAINGVVGDGCSPAWCVHPMEHELSAFYDITHGEGLEMCIRDRYTADSAQQAGRW